MKRLQLIITLLLITVCASAQRAKEMREHNLKIVERADSVTVNQLREKGITFSHNNSVTLLKSGQEKFDDMFAAIENAEESIHMEYFNFRNDSIANMLFDLLGEKATEGVEVRLLFDAFGNSSNNQPLKREHLERIRKNGIEIYEFDPLKFPWVNHVFSRDHRKIVVIDGRIGYTGGMNVADYYINGTEVVGEWHDMHCRIEGEEVNTLQQIFLAIWYDTTGQLITDNRYFQAGNQADTTNLLADECESAGSKMVGIINREPRRSSDIIRYFYVNAIDNAQEEIRLINPYFVPSRKIKKALVNAVKRGVRVEILLSARNDISLTPDCGFYNANKLSKKGCNVWLFEPGFHHTKIMTVDGQFCTVGSANLDSRSLRWDYEENAVIIDPCTTDEMNDLFEEQKERSFLLTPESWNEFRTPWQKVRGFLASLLSPFL